MDQDGPTVPPRRKKALRRIVTVLVVLVVLTVLLVGAGIAYVYYFGASTSPSATLQQAPKPQITAVQKPTAPADDARVGVSVQTITSPVKPGNNSYVAIRTLAGSTCSIDVQYNKVKATDSGLTDKKADEYGVVSWSWTVIADTPVGSWPVTLTCVRNKQSGMVTATLVVSNDADN